MPGTNTSTGSRTSPNPYIQKLQNLGSRNETPERFLQPSDPSQLMRIAEGAADRDASRQQYYADQNQQASYSRQHNMAATNANEAEIAKQKDFNRRMEEKEWDAKQSSKTITITNKVDNSGQINFNRQKELMQLQNQQELVKADRDRQSQQLLDQQRQTSERIQQAAQLAAQERLARISQETSIVAGNPGESGWRWF